ncbi:MAG: hypothetical protein VX346_19160 [Planctomycetota bacterium]|nr:hypothetical protein [Planctomycetota bacterium]
MGKAAAQQLTLLAVIGVGLLLGAAWGLPRVVGKDATALLAFGGGPILAAAVYAIWRRRAGISAAAPPRPRNVLLVLLMGPLLGALGWGLNRLVDTVTAPAEQMQMLTAFVVLGALAGAILAVALAVGSWLK